MAAFILIATYVFRLPLGIGEAYIHLGDSVIVFAASLLGGSLGAAAAAIGSGLADLLAGAGVYILPTVIIKGLMGLAAGWLLASRAEKSLLRCVLTSAACEIIMVAGYFAANVIIADWGLAVSAAPFDLIQFAAGIIGATLLVRTIKFKGISIGG